MAAGATLLRDTPPPAAPVPSEDMPVRLHDVAVEPGVSASARTELYFSPTTRCLVHGPDALRFVLALAEQLLAPGEAVALLETAQFRRVMPTNLRLELRIRPPGSAPPPAGDACVTGTLRTTAGRRLDYRGTLLPDAPIAVESGHNGAALAMLLPLAWHQVDGHDAVRLSLPADAPCLARIDASRAFGLFMLVEVLGLLTALKPQGETATHLSVALAGVLAPERLGELLRAGITLEYARLPGEAVQPAPGLLTMPFRFRFREFQPAPGSGRMAITTLSIPELVARGEARHG